MKKIIILCTLFAAVMVNSYETTEEVKKALESSLDTAKLKGEIQSTTKSISVDYKPYTNTITAKYPTQKKLKEDNPRLLLPVGGSKDNTQNFLTHIFNLSIIGSEIAEDIGAGRTTLIISKNLQTEKYKLGQELESSKLQILAHDEPVFTHDFLRAKEFMDKCTATIETREVPNELLPQLQILQNVANGVASPTYLHGRVSNYFNIKAKKEIINKHYKFFNQEKPYEKKPYEWIKENLIDSKNRSDRMAKARKYKRKLEIILAGAIPPPDIPQKIQNQLKILINTANGVASPTYPHSRAANYFKIKVKKEIVDKSPEFFIHTYDWIKNNLIDSDDRKDRMAKAKEYKRLLEIILAGGKAWQKDFNSYLILQGTLAAK